jgi:hypothetical protein
MSGKYPVESKHLTARLPASQAKAGESKAPAVSTWLGDRHSLSFLSKCLNVSTAQNLTPFLRVESTWALMYILAFCAEKKNYSTDVGKCQAFFVNFIVF